MAVAGCGAPARESKVEGGEQVVKRLQRGGLLRLLLGPHRGRGVHLLPATVQPGERPRVRMPCAYNVGTFERAPLLHRVARGVARRDAGGAQQQRGGAGEVLAVAAPVVHQETHEAATAAVIIEVEGVAEPGG